MSAQEFEFWFAFVGLVIIGTAIGVLVASRKGTRR